MLTKRRGTIFKHVVLCAQQIRACSSVCAPNFATILASQHPLLHFHRAKSVKRSYKIAFTRTATTQLPQQNARAWSAFVCGQRVSGFKVGRPPDYSKTHSHYSRSTIRGCDVEPSNLRAEPLHTVRAAPHDDGAVTETYTTQAASLCKFSFAGVRHFSRDVKRPVVCMRTM